MKKKLVIISKDVKKTAQDEEEIQDQLKSNSEKKTVKVSHDEHISEESKDGEQ